MSKDMQRHKVTVHGGSQEQCGAHEVEIKRIKTEADEYAGLMHSLG